MLSALRSHGERGLLGRSWAALEVMGLSRGWNCFSLLLGEEDRDRLQVPVGTLTRPWS